MSLDTRWEAIFAVMAEASVGKMAGRVALSPEPDVEDLPTRFAITLNQLLDDLEFRSAKLEAQLVTTRQQAEAIRALSLPVLIVDEKVVLMPIIGVIDAERAGQLLGTVLTAINTTGATAVLIDLTGVTTVDAVAAKALVDTAYAASLMGASPLLCGIRAQVAAEIKAVGGDILRLKIVSSLRSGVAAVRAR